VPGLVSNRPSRSRFDTKPVEPAGSFSARPVRCWTRPADLKNLKTKKQINLKPHHLTYHSVFERIHTKKRNRLEQKRLNDLVFVQYNLQLRHNQLLNKRLDTDPIVLDDNNPTSEWVEESHPAEFDPDRDMDDLGLGLDSVPLGEAGKSEAPSMAHATQVTRAFASTTTSATAVKDVPKENEEPEDSESEDDFVAGIAADDDPIPSSGDEFDD
jgi:hypothetical protein